MCRPSSQWLWICKLSHWDNQLIFGDIRLQHMHPYEVLLDEGFYGRPIFLETEPDQEFLGFCLEFEPFALRYSPHLETLTYFNQVMAPFSASPHWTSNFRASCPDCFWSPNVRTPNPSSFEVLPRCIVCTELQVFRNPI